MSSNLVTVKTAFYNNRQTIDLILTLSFGQGGTNAHRCEEKEVVLEERRLYYLEAKKYPLNKLFNITATGLKCKHVLMVSSLFYHKQGLCCAC